MLMKSNSARANAAGIAAAAIFAAPGLAADLVISNWDGYMAADAIESFNEATGNNAELVLHGTNEEIMGKIMASGGKGLDVAFVSSPFAEVLRNLGLAAEIDASKIPNMSNLYPEAMMLEHDVGNKFSVPYAWGTTGLCYRSDLIQPAPESWNDLLDPDESLRGKTTMLATDRWLLAAGLLAKGYSVNETDIAKLEEVRDQLIETKETLLAYDDTTFYLKLVSGEATLVHAWDGWCNFGIAENSDIAYIVPAEGSDLWVDTMVVLEASENKDAAFAFINFILDADNHQWAAENILYKVPNKAAMDALPPELIEAFPNMGYSADSMLNYEQLRDVGETQRDYARIVSEIKAAQ
ncbi:MAG: spermidine/putrescine ABC transporter substrate-binding protein [Albidovulum sp.]|nr:spermidine/putrescine ABC transporter substrate-binding protein [Albidovulum sp.]